MSIPRTFSVIPPIAITDAMLASSTVPELGPDDPAVWVSGTSYSVGNRRSVIATHRIYECIQATGSRTTSPQSDPLFWIEVEATQRWKMFDPLRMVKTTHTSPMVVELETGLRANAWFVGGVNAQTLTVTMINDGVTVYSRTVSMTRRSTRSWSDYFFGTFGPVRSALDNNMPPISGATIRFEFASSTGTVSVGKLVVGRSIELGATEAGAEIDAENYSSVERSEVDGTAINLTQRRNVPTTSQVIFFNPEDTDILLSLRDQLNASPAVWSALGSQFKNDYYAALAIYGLYERFRITADGSQYARLQLDLKEM